MSQALPMSTSRRAEIYNRDSWTPRKRRQCDRMQVRELDRSLGGLPPHGATGIPTRRPIVRPSAPPERGSIRTHIAAYCAPCDVHWRRPRLHRYLGVVTR